MDRQTARKLAKTLAREAGETLIRLGNVLSIIYEGQFWWDWGYHSWNEYVENDLGMSYGTTHELIILSNWISHEHLTKTQQNEVSKLGRCKASLLTKAATKLTLEDWMKKARRYTVNELRQAVLGRPIGQARRVLGVGCQKHERMEIEKALTFAKDETHVESTRGERLTQICIEYNKLRERQVKAASKKKKTGSGPLLHVV